jgi:HTH-type transcriptional regulator/antitoxin HipB
VRTQRHINSAKALGRAIRDQRKSLGLNQTSAGRLVGVHQTTVSAVEQGVSKVKIDTLLKILAALRLELLVQPIQSQETPWEEVWANDGA